jgi:hypothetical protein
MYTSFVYNLQILPPRIIIMISGDQKFSFRHKMFRCNGHGVGNGGGRAAWPELKHILARGTDLIISSTAWPVEHI